MLRHSPSSPTNLPTPEHGTPPPTQHGNRQWQQAMTKCDSKMQSSFATRINKHNLSVAIWCKFRVPAKVPATTMVRSSLPSSVRPAGIRQQFGLVKSRSSGTYKLGKVLLRPKVASYFQLFIRSDRLPRNTRVMSVCYGASSSHPCPLFTPRIVAMIDVASRPIVDAEGCWHLPIWDMV